MPKWAEVTCSWSVVFEKVAVHVEPVEHTLRNRLIAAIGHALGIIPAAHMDADRHIGQSVYDRVIDHIDVKINELVGAVAPRAQLPCCLGRKSQPTAPRPSANRCRHAQQDPRSLGAHDPVEKSAVQARSPLSHRALIVVFWQSYLL